MTIRVLLFAQLAEAIGRRELTLDLADGGTVADAVRSLAHDHTAIAQMHERLATAVNDHYASGDVELSDGDALALIPPVSGG